MKQYSFVIPTYNNKKLLKNTLESLNYQEGFGEKDYEVIVVDDGSSDGTNNFIQDVAKTYEMKYIYLERTPNAARSRARNTGWQSAEGRIIIFIDSDIIVNRNYLKELSQCYALNEDLCVIGNRYYLHDDVSYEQMMNGSIYDTFKKVKGNLKNLEDRHYKYNQFSYNISVISNPWLLTYSCNIAIPKKRLDEIKGFDEEFTGWGMEDAAVGYKLIKNGVQIIVNKELEVLHQYHGELYGTPFGPKKVIQMYENIDIMYKKFKEMKKDLSRLHYLYSLASHRYDSIFHKKYKVKETIILEFNRNDNISDLKNKIIELSSVRGNKIVLRDFEETSDLQLWVQLLGETPGPIYYYPMSFHLDKKEIQNYFKKTLKRNYFKIISSAFVNLYVLFVYRPFFYKK